MTKPFAFRELLLRVQNMLKRAGGIAARSTALRAPVRIGIATVDFDRFTAETNGELHRLTHKECAVLKLLLERAGRAVSRDEILQEAWAPDEFPTERTVDILSIRGVGYQLGSER
jgi:two-component system alkaline phosphatase synthesis response regulator PhoP